MHISLDAPTVKTICLKVYQSAAVRLGFAIAIIAGIYWWMTRTQAPSLQDRVTKLEVEVEGFWLRVANRAIYNPRIISENVWLQRAQWDLKKLQQEIQGLPHVQEGAPLAGRIKKLHETAACKMSFNTPSKAPSTTDVKQLMNCNWTERVTAYEERLEMPAEELKEYQAVLVAQITEVFKQTPKEELFTCLVRVHRVGKRLMSPRVKLEKVKACLSTTNAGLERGGNNSCYLAAALQLFRSFDTLKCQFDPTCNPLNNELSNRIQINIQSMLTRMDLGVTIPVRDGELLQQQLKEAGILTEAVDYLYDAGEIAAAILYRMGYEFPKGVHEKELRGKETKTIVDPDYHPVIASSELSIDVENAVARLIVPKEEDVEGYGKQVEYVKELPEFMVVEFLGCSELINVEKFSDPTNHHYEYELVFAMKNTGDHWVAHKKVSENQWITANDALITPMQENALSHIHRGYYLRKAKFEGVD